MTLVPPVINAADEFVLIYNLRSFEMTIEKKQ